MNDFHGNYTREQESSIKGLITVNTPLVVIGTAPINMGDLNNVNKPQLITSTAEANDYFGGYSVKGFSIHEALEVALVHYGIKPIICINVLDPKLHKTEGKTEVLNVSSKKIVFNQVGIFLDTVKIKDKTTESSKDLEVNEYILKFLQTGEVEVVILKEGVTKVEGSYSYLDTELVTELDVIGAVTPGTTKKTGLEVVDDIFATTKMLPSVVIVPDFDDKPSVISALATKCNLISNKYGCMGIASLPKDINYSEAIEEKAKLNCLYPDLILTYGDLKQGDKIYKHSIHLAALMNAVDFKNQGIPYESPSNKLLRANALVIKDKSTQEYEECRLDEVTQANFLNSNGISTAIARSNGFVAWGNKTSCYQPGGNTDPKDMWIPMKRMFKYIANTIILTNDIEINKPMDRNKAEYITRTINNFLDGLTTAGKLMGGRCEFTENENPEQNMVKGMFTWHLYIGGITPFESGHYILEYDKEYQKAIFK